MLKRKIMILIISILILLWGIVLTKVNRVKLDGLVVPSKTINEINNLRDCIVTKISEQNNNLIEIFNAIKSLQLFK